MNDHIIITDVGPRDGLQNQPGILTPAERLRLIQSIAEAGIRHIEVGSFVSPKAVPAMAGTDTVMAELPSHVGMSYSALIPNMRGYELARAVGARAVTMVLYASDGMARKNVNMSMLQAEQATIDILECARADGIEVTATISVAFACPFDGLTDPGIVRSVAQKFIALGADQIVIADTIGGICSISPTNWGATRTTSSMVTADMSCRAVTFPAASSVSVSMPSTTSPTYRFDVFSTNRSNFVAIPTATTSTPVASGSRVPAWPTWRS